MKTVPSVLIVCGRFFHTLLPSCLSLQHEKYTSQLQLSVKSMDAKLKEKQSFQNPEKSKDAISNVKLQDKAERRAQSLTGEHPVLHRSKAVGLIVFLLDGNSCN